MAKRSESPLPGTLKAAFTALDNADLTPDALLSRLHKSGAIDRVRIAVDRRLKKHIESQKTHILSLSDQHLKKLFSDGANIPPPQLVMRQAQEAVLATVKDRMRKDVDDVTERGEASWFLDAVRNEISACANHDTTSSITKSQMPDTNRTNDASAIILNVNRNITKARNAERASQSTRPADTNSAAKPREIHSASNHTLNPLRLLSDNAAMAEPQHNPPAETQAELRNETRNETRNKSRNKNAAASLVNAKGNAPDALPASTASTAAQQSTPALHLMEASRQTASHAIAPHAQPADETPDKAVAAEDAVMNDVPLHREGNPSDSHHIGKHANGENPEEELTSASPEKEEKDSELAALADDILLGSSSDDSIDQPNETHRREPVVRTATNDVTVNIESLQPHDSKSSANPSDKPKPSARIHPSMLLPREDRNKQAATESTADAVQAGQPEQESKEPQSPLDSLKDPSSPLDSSGVQPVDSGLKHGRRDSSSVPGIVTSTPKLSRSAEETDVNDTKNGELEELSSKPDDETRDRQEEDIDEDAGQDPRNTKEAISVETAGSEELSAKAALSAEVMVKKLSIPRVKTTPETKSDSSKIGEGLRESRSENKSGRAGSVEPETRSEKSKAERGGSEANISSEHVVIAMEDVNTKRSDKTDSSEEVEQRDDHEGDEERKRNESHATTDRRRSRRPSEKAPPRKEYVADGAAHIEGSNDDAPKAAKRPGTLKSRRVRAKKVRTSAQTENEENVIAEGKEAHAEMKGRKKRKKPMGDAAPPKTSTPGTSFDDVLDPADPNRPRGYSDARSDSPLDYADQQKILRSLKKVLQRELALPFSVPVDTTEKGCEMYNSVIPNPMDLGEICKRLTNSTEEEGYYLNVKEILEDIDLVWWNCKKYNGQFDPIITACDRCQLELSFLLEQQGITIQRSISKRRRVSRGADPSSEVLGATPAKVKESKVKPVGVNDGSLVGQRVLIFTSRVKGKKEWFGAQVMSFDARSNSYALQWEGTKQTMRKTTFGQGKMYPVYRLR